jgi:hypothetical protein
MPEIGRTAASARRRARPSLGASARRRSEGRPSPRRWWPPRHAPPRPSVRSPRRRPPSRSPPARSHRGRGVTIRHPGLRARRYRFLDQVIGRKAGEAGPPRIDAHIDRNRFLSHLGACGGERQVSKSTDALRGRSVTGLRADRLRRNIVPGPGAQGDRRRALRRPTPETKRRAVVPTRRAPPRSRPTNSAPRHRRGALVIAVRPREGPRVPLLPQPPRRP